MELEDEGDLKRKLKDIEHNAFLEKINVVMQEANVTEAEAIQLLEKYNDTWTFTNNVSKSGDSFIVTLPKKEARFRGIKKSTPLLVSVRILRFH
jgi:hypothetical protein